jgi:hypothetical protein
MAEVDILPAGDTLAGSLIYSVPLKTAGQILHRGRSWLYEALGAGLLDAVKNGVNTEITVESIRRYQANMPRVTIKAAKPHNLESLHKLHEKQHEERARRRAARRRAFSGGAK